MQFCDILFVNIDHVYCTVDQRGTNFDCAKSYIVWYKKKFMNRPS